MWSWVVRSEPPARFGESDQRDFLRSSIIPFSERIEPNYTSASEYLAQDATTPRLGGVVSDHVIALLPTPIIDGKQETRARKDSWLRQ